MHMALLTAANLPVVPVSEIKLVAAFAVLGGIILDLTGLEVGEEEGN